MCFSASASFAASALLTAAGTQTLRKVKKPSQLILASVPLLFALQQLAEGILWTVIGHKVYPVLESIATYAFVTMAKVVWPLMLPLAMLILEKSSVRKKIMGFCLACGAAVSFYYLYSLLFFTPYAQIKTLHVAYFSDFPSPYWMEALVLYLLATIVPLFISTLKKAYILGIALIISFTISAVFFIHYLTSVWCFFAAVMSVVIYFMVRDNEA